MELRRFASSLCFATEFSRAHCTGGVPHATDRNLRVE